MNGIKRVGDLELEEDLAYYRKFWVLQKAGWGIMALLLIAAFLGFMGPGLLGKTRAGGTNDAFWLEYERSARIQASTALHLHIRTDTLKRTGDTVPVWGTHAYLDTLHIKSVVPSPVFMEGDSRKAVYHFKARDDGMPMVVSFHVEPQKPGLLAGAFGVTGGPVVTFTQLVYP